MGIRAERLFEKLQTIDALRELIGTSETSDLECKQWLGPEANQSGLAKAACGLANAEGGVIVIGMEGRKRPNKPDKIESFSFVPNVQDVAMIAREIVADVLEPGLRNIKTTMVTEREGESVGCIVIYIPEEDGTPQRVKKGGQFYVRMATGTLPMLYTQIADRFGRRPHAKLLVVPTDLTVNPRNNIGGGNRTLGLFVENVGRGSARFPALRCLKGGGLNPYPGPYGINTPRWPHLDDSEEWFSYRGSANDVVHPGDKVVIAWLSQNGQSAGEPIRNRFGGTDPSPNLYFPAVALQTSIVCEGMPDYLQSFGWEELQYDPQAL